MQVPEVFFLNPHSLAPHPLLAAIPTLDPASPEFQALKASIRDRGVDYPVIVDENDRLLDGRNRCRAAAEVGAELPCLKRNSAEAPEIILSALLNRRHLRKGARAYLCAPLFAPAVEAGRQRKLANLRVGEISRQSADRTIGKTVEQLADEMGFGRSLFFLAAKVRKLFEDEDVRTWHDGPREVKATYRQWFEARLLAGEIDLGGIIQAVAGKANEDAGPLDRATLPALFTRAFNDLKNRAARWETMSIEDRRAVSHAAQELMAELPEPLREAMLTGAEKAAAHPRTKPGF